MRVVLKPQSPSNMSVTSIWQGVARVQFPSKALIYQLKTEWLATHIECPATQCMVEALGTVHSEPSYTRQRQRSTPAFSRGRLSAQNPHTVLSRICMKLDIKTLSC